MLKKSIIATTCAFFAAGMLAVAQADDDVNPPVGTSGEMAEEAVADEAETTLVGCLYTEDQVPGRSPNIAERAGVLEDYILVLDDTAEGQQAEVGVTPGAAGTTGAAGVGNMFKVEHIDDDQLRSMVGKRVEVTGKIDAEEGGADRPIGTGGEPDRSLGPDEINLPEFEATSIREVEGTCPASAEPRQ